MFVSKILFCIFLGSVFSYLLYNKLLKNNKTLWVYLMMFFRFVTVSLLSYILFNIFYEKNYKINIKPKLLFFMDNTMSIKISKKELIEKDLLSKIKNNKIINDKYDVSILSFGEKLNLNIDTLNFNEKITDFSLIKNFIENNSTENTLSVICTDGISNLNSHIEDIGNDNSIIHSIFCGDSIEVPDIYIEKIIVNKTARLNNMFPVKIKLKGNSVPINNYEIKITDINKKEIKKVIIKNKHEDFNEDIDVNIIAEKKGLNKFTINIETLKNEHNKYNNSKTFSIDVIDKRNNILLLSSNINPDIGIFKRIYGNNDNFNFEFKKIETINNYSDLNIYNLFILINPENEIEKISQYLKNKNIIYVFSKKDSDLSFINNFYQKELLTNIEIPNNIPDNLNNYFNIFKIGNDDIVYNLPPLTQTKKLEIPINNQNLVLYKKLNDINIPTMFFIERGKNTDLFLLTNDFWKWRVYNYKLENNTNFIDDLLEKIGLYLSAEEKAKIFLDYKKSYQEGEDIKFELKYLNEISDLKTTDSLNIYFNKDSINYKFEFNLSENSYISTIKGLDVGAYSFFIKDGNKLLQKGDIIIDDRNLEYDNIKGNIKGLRILSKKNKGNVYTENKIDDFFSDIEKFKLPTIIANRTKINNLQDSWFLLIILVFSITIEWIIRKYMDLL